MTEKIPPSDYFDVSKHGHVLEAAPSIAAAASRGPRLVGERGPELVNLPRGSRIVPNHRMGVPMSEDEVRRIVREELSADDHRLRTALAHLLAAVKTKFSENSP